MTSDPNNASDRLCGRCGYEVLPGDESVWSHLRHKDLLCLIYLAKRGSIVMVPDAWSRQDTAP